jgi:hypothetical protein
MCRSLTRSARKLVACLPSKYLPGQYGIFLEPRCTHIGSLIRDPNLYACGWIVGHRREQARGREVLYLLTLRLRQVCVKLQRPLTKRAEVLLVYTVERLCWSEREGIQSILRWRRLPIPCCIAPRGVIQGLWIVLVCHVFARYHDHLPEFAAYRRLSAEGT